MNTKVLNKLGFSIKTIRKDKKLTQEQLAEKVGIHPTYVGKIESGKINVPTLMLYKISRALNVKLSDIFSFD
ncbi:MAG TPA: XRE family transcriptional regulator [Cyanobacteria bacterium UBA11991]|nr:helix-turn-helix transcriptional regulator [Cyanobacteriota bacterium]MDY6358654.1 helix-turn-helix transcriptional regulator [Cyanobacteriota bacterium]MDY6363691.1 helix-turn-helix transcriptional regulator [Cyanobacteriota bacterium]MDY6383588.1 helix-turn-helix transcriptional regulator [Cyanobacteriota bacterium]HCB10872.1 XRE family transcriptional regulator [Cyanobacteria bacterium UBA11991]